MLTRVNTNAATPTAMICSGWNTRLNQWPSGRLSSTSSGATSSAICVDDPAAMASAVSILFFAASCTALKCSAVLPTIGTTTSPTKNCDQPSASVTASTVLTSASASSTVPMVAASSTSTAV